MKNNPYGQRQGQTGTGKPDSSRVQRTAAPAGTNQSGQSGQTGQQNQQGQQGQQGFGQGSTQVRKPVTVWIKTGDTIHRVRVATGAIDGTNAEIKFGVKEGDEVVLSMTMPGKSASTTTTAASQPATSPFMPTRAPAGARGR
jgi:hypothetical protein